MHKFIDRAVGFLTSDDMSSAKKELDTALKNDTGDLEVLTALQYIAFWIERERTLLKITNAFEKGEYVLNQWKIFQKFINGISPTVGSMLHALKIFAFHKALQAFKACSNAKENKDDVGLQLSIGRCYKGMGQFDAAIQYLQTAVSKSSNDPEILAEFADALALINETTKAKAVFREAFFLDAQQINLAGLESGLIQPLIQKGREKGHNDEVLCEWIPVYGVLFGVFNVQRELRSVEYGRLNQAIFELEREWQEKKQGFDIIKPRLLNHYFWLIDHFISSKEDKTKIDEVLLRIRSIDEDVYYKYTA